MSPSLLNPFRFASGGPITLPSDYGAISYTESSHFSGFVPSRVCDKDPNNRWVCNTATGWVAIRYSTQFVATEYFVHNQSCKDWQFQGSNDGSSWTTLDTRSGVALASYNRFTFSNSTAYEYYRLNVTAIWAGQFTPEVWEIGVEADRIVYASAINNDIGFDPYLGARWITTNGWIDFSNTANGSGRWFQVDLGAQVSQAMTRYGFRTTNIAGWTLHGSNDVAFGTSTLLDTQTGNTTTGGPSTTAPWSTGSEIAFQFTNTTVFRYYRLTCTNSIGGGSIKANVSRFRLLT